MAGTHDSWRLLTPPGETFDVVSIEGHLRQLRTLVRSPGTHTRRYLTVPSLSDLRRAVPADHPGALRWYWRNLFVPGRPTHVAIALGARALLAVRGDRLLAALAPSSCSVTAIDPTPALIPDSAHAAAWLVLAGGWDAASRVVYLGFGEGAEDPHVAVKVVARASAAASLAEQDRLADLRSRLPEVLAATLPTPMGSAVVGDAVAVVQRALPGPSLQHLASSLVRPRRQKGRDLECVVAWLCDFHSATRDAEVTWTRDRAEETLVEPLQGLLDRWAPQDAAPLLARCRSVAGAALGCRFPLVEEHYDLAPVNVLLDGTNVGVVDWELDRVRAQEAGAGMPGRDLASWRRAGYFAARRADGSEAERAAVAELARDGGVLARAARSARRSYAGRLGLAPETMAVAELSVWVERALHHERRWHELGGDVGRCPPEVASSLGVLTALLARARPCTSAPARR